MTDTEIELTSRQLAAVEAWHEARRADRAAPTGPPSRELRMDLARREDVWRAQHRAIVARLDEQLRESARLLSREVPRRAVVAHRQSWFRDKLTAELQRRQVQVVDAPENGAEVVGVVVAEQPDLLLVEEILPMLPGAEVLREARRFSPGTVCVAHVESAGRVPVLLEAGARAAFPRQVPPADVALAMAELLVREQVST